MIKNINCLLCNSNTSFFYEKRNKTYYKCEKCSSIMLDPLDHVSLEEEKERYETHNNDIEDISYQNFVSPIVESIKKTYNTGHIGLDYGAGPGPVVKSLLEKEGYNIKLYDPYFHYYPKNLYDKYDFIILSEVIEHFNNPYKEFLKLSNLLKKGGALVCMTSIYDEGIDFDKWSYKNDKTHVFFYHKKALEWIKAEFKFSNLEVDGKLIKLSK